MELSTFAKAGRKDVVDAYFKRVVFVQGVKLTVELTSLCWLEGRRLSITVTGKLGQYRFDSPRLFRDAKLPDLEKLIRRVRRIEKCRQPGCAGKYLVDDCLRTENPKRLCERHRLLELQKERARTAEARERDFKLLDPKRYGAIVRTGGLQDDEQVQDAVYVYAGRIAGAIKGNENARKLFEDIDAEMGSETDARAVLGVADYLLKSGAVIDKRARSYVLARLKVELRPNVLDDWDDPAERRKDLNEFRKRLSTADSLSGRN